MVMKLPPIFIPAGSKLADLSPRGTDLHGDFIEQRPNPHAIRQLMGLPPGNPNNPYQFSRSPIDGKGNYTRMSRETVAGVPCYVERVYRDGKEIEMYRNGVLVRRNGKSVFE